MDRAKSRTKKPNATLPSHVIHTARSGTYFSNAGARYVNSAIPLWCDLCGKEPLLSCIGANGVDLCLACVDNIHRSKALTFKE